MKYSHPTTYTQPVTYSATLAEVAAPTKIQGNPETAKYPQPSTPNATFNATMMPKWQYRMRYEPVGLYIHHAGVYDQFQNKKTQKREK